MRRKALAVGALVGAAAVGIFRWSRGEPQGPSFAMCIAHGAAAADDDAFSEAVLAAIVRTLSSEQRASLEDALRVSAERWESRANPLVDDIEGVEPDQTLEAWFKNAPSFVRSARAAAHARACGADGFCATARTSSRCPVGWTEASSAADVGRARFLVWSWGHAVRLRASSEGEARSAAARVRESIPASRRIALVLAPDDDAATKAAPFIEIREAWKRRLGVREIALDEAAALPQDSGPPGDTREIVVLPRFETIAEEAALEAEVLSVAPGLERIGADALR